MNRYLLSGCVLMFVGATAGCDPCGNLEERICGDLGEAGCGLWKNNGGPATLRTGRRPKKSCTNALVNYEPHLNAAKATVSVYRNVPAASNVGPRGTTPSLPSTVSSAGGQDEDCKKLEEKLCGNLGGKCAAWKKAGKAGLAGRNAVQCRQAVGTAFFYKKALKDARAAMK